MVGMTLSSKDGVLSSLDYLNIDAMLTSEEIAMRQTICGFRWFSYTRCD